MLPQNFEPDGQTCLSVRSVLEQRRAHCLEGAMVAALALWVHGEPPLLLDLKASHDYDHVVAVFRRGGHWGAISKTNNSVLRYRDPVYRTLRSWAGPFDLRRMDPKIWVTNQKSCWDVGYRLEEIRHWPLVTTRQLKLLRLRDTVERQAAKVRQHEPPPARRD